MPSSGVSTSRTATTTFTPRQRMLCALRGQPADRVPGWLMRQAGRYLPQYHAVRDNFSFLELCKNPVAAAEVSIQPLEAIGSDAVIIFNDILLPLEHAGAEVDFDDRGPIVRNPITAAAELAALPEAEVSPTEPIVGTLQEVRRQVGPDFPILGFIGAPWTLACYWLEGRVGKSFSAIGSMRFRDPDLLHAVLERVTRAAGDYLMIQIEQGGADAVQIFDTWGSILNAAEWDEFSGQYIRRIIERVHAACETPVILYLNGCAPYLERMAATGPDVISVDWRITMAEARRRVASEIALQGNMDPLVLVNEPAVARAAIAKFFKDFPAGPGHVFNMGHGVIPQTRPESARALMEALKQHGVY